MITFLVEEGIRGIIGALFFAFTQRVTPNKIEWVNTYKPEPEDVLFQLHTSEPDIKRVEKALIKYAGLDVIADMNTCLCLNDKKANIIVFNYASAILTSRRRIKDLVYYPDVYEFFEGIDKVNEEIERTCSFIRLTPNLNGLHFAEFCPVNDLTKPVARSLATKYQKTPFVLHDIRRGKIAISNGRSLYYENCGNNTGFDREKTERYYNELKNKYCIKKA